MEKAKHFKLKEYSIYKKFIDECFLKKYDENIVLHKHHIIPKHIWMNESKSVNNKDNLIYLSIEDHITSHLLLAECYDKNTYEYNSNLKSARILNNKSIKDIHILNKISESYIGDGNPFYGKNHTSDTIKILSAATKKQCNGVSYQERYGDNADIEKQKRKSGVKKYWDTISLNEKEKRIKNVSNALKGKNCGNENPFATKMLINDVYYGSLKEACMILNVNRYQLYKNYNVKILNKK